MLPSMKIVPLTVSNFVDAFHESSPRTVLPAADLQVYDDAGVRLIAVVGVALQLIELSATPLAVSNVGGVPSSSCRAKAGRGRHCGTRSRGRSIVGRPAGRIEPAVRRAAGQRRDVGEEGGGQGNDVVVDGGEDLVGVPLRGRRAARRAVSGSPSTSSVRPRGSRRFEDRRRRRARSGSAGSSGTDRDRRLPSGRRP